VHHNSCFVSCSSDPTTNSEIIGPTIRKFSDQLEFFFTIIACFFFQKQSDGLKNSENSGFLVSELEVGSGEQGIFIFF